jgi:hypothetical protein
MNHIVPASVTFFVFPTQSDFTADGVAPTPNSLFFFIFLIVIPTPAANCFSFLLLPLSARFDHGRSMIAVSGGLRVNISPRCHPFYPVAFCVYILMTAVTVQARVRETHQILLLSCPMHLLSLWFVSNVRLFSLGYCWPRGVFLLSVSVFVLWQ